MNDACSSSGVPARLPEPGKVLQADYRRGPKEATKRLPEPGRQLKLVQWNIERGYELEAVIAELEALDADIVGVQEVDMFCKRSGCKDVGKEIAERLGYNYAFVCEFEELESPVRDERSQGGGVHGNGLLTKFNVRHARSISHDHDPVGWAAPDNPLARREPRRGQRVTLAAEVLTPDGPLLCYSVHLEEKGLSHTLLPGTQVFCGVLDRMLQFADVLRDSRANATRMPHQVVFGDLNTMAHGVARLSPNYARDWLRWGSLGWYESEVWQRYVFDVREQLQLDRGNDMARKLGIADEGICNDLVNPGFADPFPLRGATLDNPSFRIFGVSLMEGKLDWLLLRQCKVLSHAMGNDDYGASDHKWLVATVQLV